MPQVLLTSESEITDLLVFPASDNLELMELFITGSKGTNKEDFLKKFRSILEKTPRIGTTTEAEFFTYYTIGAFTVLPNTSLLNKLSLKHVYINPIKSSEKGKMVIKTVKVALQLEEAGKKQIALYTFATTKGINAKQHWSLEEIREVIAYLKITQSELESYKIDSTLQVSGKIYHVQNNKGFDLQVEDIKISSEDKSISYKALTSEFERLIEQTPLPQSQKTEFTEIIRLTEDVVNSGKSKNTLVTDLESHFQKLSSHAEEEGSVNAPLNEVPEAVAIAGSNIIKDLVTLYNYWQPILNLGRSEVCYQAYTYGVLENLFKYRYALDISVEKILGQGRADLLFISRLDGLFNKNWEAIPVTVEFKAHLETPQKAIEQIESRGYLRHTPRIRTLSTKGVALGANFNPAYSHSVISAIKEIKVEPINFIKSFLAIGHQMIQMEEGQLTAEKKQAQQTENEDLIKESLLDIDYSIVRQNGANDNSNYFKTFVLGQAMGAFDSESSIYVVFETSDYRGSSVDQDLSLFFAQDSKLVILIINGLLASNDLKNKMSGLDLDQTKSKLAFLKAKGVLVEISHYFIATVDVNNRQSTPSLKENQYGVISDLLASAGVDNQKNFAFKKINPFKFIQNDRIAYKELGRELLDFRKEGLEITNSESDLQALFQSGLLASGEVQVFTESNHVLGKRADLVVAPFDRKNGHRPLKIIELKYTESQAAEKVQDEAINQVRLYARNTKSFSDGSKLELIAITYNAKSSLAKSLFLYDKVLKEIVHTSGSEWIANSPVSSQEDHDDIHETLESNRDAQEVESHIEENPPLKTDGFKTPPWRSPDPGYIGDRESNVESSPDVKSAGVLSLGNLLGGIAAWLGTLLGALGTTAATVTNAISQTRNLMAQLQKMSNREAKLLEEIEEVFKEIGQLGEEVAQMKAKDALRQVKEKAESLSKVYQRQGKEVTKKLTNKRKQAELIRTKNKRKKELAGSSRAKREALLNWLSREWLMRQQPDRPFNNFPEELLNLTDAVADADPSRLFSLCTINYGDKEASLDCYLSIDYQDVPLTIVDVSLWNLENKTLQYFPCQDQLHLTLPMFNAGEENLVFPNASHNHYEWIDTHANIFAPYPKVEPINCRQESTVETTTNRVTERKVDTGNSTMPLLPILDRIIIANCTQVELSATYNARYSEGDCIINPIANTISVIEVNLPPKPNNSVLINFNSWNVLQQMIICSGLPSNVLVIDVEHRFASNENSFLVQLNHYFDSSFNSTHYTFSDTNFDKLGLIFRENQIQTLRLGSPLNVSMAHVEVATPAAALNLHKNKAEYLVDWYQNRTQSNAHIDVLYGEMVNPEGTRRVFGSRFSDKLFLDKIMFVYGGEAKDCYIVKPSRLDNTVLYIANDAEDKINDYLVLPVLFKTLRLGIVHNNSMTLRSTQANLRRKLILVDYCDDKSKQHLNVLTKDGILFELPACERLIKTCTRHQPIPIKVIKRNVTGDILCAGTTDRKKHYLEKGSFHVLKKRELARQRNQDTELKARVKKGKVYSSFFHPSIETDAASTPNNNWNNHPTQQLRIEEKQTSKPYPNMNLPLRYEGTLSENVPFIKWLAYFVLGRHERVKLINKAEKTLSGSLEENYVNSGLPEDLYWAKQQLEAGIALYDRKRRRPLS